MKVTSAITAVLLVATWGGSANPLPPPDQFELYNSSNLELAIWEKHVVFNSGPWEPPIAPPMVFTGVPGNPALVDSPTYFKNPQGTVGDIFGVFDNPFNGHLELAYISGDSLGEAPAGAIPEPVSFDATLYLDIELQDQGYTAFFFASPVYRSPDAGNTVGLLALSLGALVVVRGRTRSRRTTG